MTNPEWLKPGINDAVIGAVFVCVVGFSLGGWMTGSGANKMASAMADDDVIAALVPVCLKLARTDTERVAKLATNNEVASYKRRDAVVDAGRATMPGSEVPDGDLAQACMDLSISTRSDEERTYPTSKKPQGLHVT